jgi:hypothetical protein
MMLNAFGTDYTGRCVLSCSSGCDPLFSSSCEAARFSLHLGLIQQRGKLSAISTLEETLSVRRL